LVREGNMDVWILVIIATLGTVFGGLTLGLLNASAKLFYKKVWARITKRPLIKPKLMAEMRSMEEMIPGLLRINAIPSDPDYTKYKDVWEILTGIGEKAKDVEDKSFKELRGGLLAFSANTDKLDVNMNSLAILKVLGRDTAMKLVEDIRTKISEIINENIKKKK
jgi:hypothetical protein